MSMNSSVRLANEFVGGVEEVALHLEVSGTRHNLVAHTYYLFYATAFGHVCHPGIQCPGCFAALQYVAQDESVASVAYVGAPAHEVECYVERVDIGVVGVVDECAPVDSVLHFESHGHRFECRHALAYLFDVNVDIFSEAEACSQTDDRVLDGCIVDEWYGVLSLLSVEGVGYSGCASMFFHAFHHWPAFHLVEYFAACHFADEFVLQVDDCGVAVFEQLEFFVALAFVCEEVLLVSFAYVGDYAYVGAYHAVEVVHLAGV